MKSVAMLDPLGHYRKAFSSAAGGTLDKALVADQTHYLSGDMLTKVDRMSMAHGLEIRVPYLERPMMELANRIDGSLLSPFLGAKKLGLRDFASKLGITPAIIKQKKKGFNVPVASLLRNELSSLSERFFTRDPDIFAPLLEPGRIKSLWCEHKEKKADNGYMLWALLVHAVWREKHST